MSDNRLINAYFYLKSKFVEKRFYDMKRIWITALLAITLLGLAKPALAQDPGGDSGSFFPAVQAYYSAQNIVKKIAQRVNAKLLNEAPGQSIHLLITNAGGSFAPIYASYQGYKDVFAMLTSLNARYERLEKEPGAQPGVRALGLTGITDAVTLITDLGNLFKMEVKVTEAKVNLDLTALTAQLGSEFDAKITSAFDRFPPPDSTVSDLYQTCITTKIKVNADPKVDQTKLAALNQEFDKVQALLSDPNVIFGCQVGALYNNFFTNPKPKQYLLDLKVAQAGGAGRTLSGLFNSGSASFTGGAIIAFFLYDQNCNIIDSGTLVDFKGYQRVMDGEGYIQKTNP